MSAGAFTNSIPINGETWLICGGRSFSDEEMFSFAMANIVDLRGCPSRVVHGDAAGADRMAVAWGRRMVIEVRACPADWPTYGASAGPIRNQEMLDKYKPSVVIAFPGGRGTADMVARARLTKAAVIEVIAE